MAHPAVPDKRLQCLYSRTFAGAAPSPNVEDRLMMLPESCPVRCTGRFPSSEPRRCADLVSAGAAARGRAGEGARYGPCPAPRVGKPPTAVRAQALQEPLHALRIQRADGQRCLARPGDPTSATVRRCGTWTSISCRWLGRAPCTLMTLGNVTGTRISLAGTRSKLGPRSSGRSSSAARAPARVLQRP